MPQILFLSVAISLVLVGCSKDPAPSSPEIPAAPASTAAATPQSDSAPAPAAAAETNVEGTLAELTQALRKYSAEKRQVPTSLNELVAGGYIANLPPAPAGKSFAIDTKNLKVILK